MLKPSAKSAALVFLCMSCGRPSASLPPDVPDPASSYEQAITAWMADAEEVEPPASPGWKTYRFSSTASGTSKILEELRGAFGGLCRRAGGTVVPRGNFGPEGSLLTVCKGKSEPLFAIVFDGSPELELSVSHLNVAGARQAVAKLDADEAQRRATERRNGAKTAKREAEAQATADAELRALRASVDVGHRIGVVFDGRTARGLVTELRDQLVRVQTDEGLVWVKRDQLVAEATVLKEEERQARHRARQGEVQLGNCKHECARLVFEKCAIDTCLDPAAMRDACTADCMRRPL